MEYYASENTEKKGTCQNLTKHKSLSLFHSLSLSLPLCIRALIVHHGPETTYPLSSQYLVVSAWVLSYAYLLVQQERTEEAASVPSEEFTFVFTQANDLGPSEIIPVTCHHGHD